MKGKKVLWLITMAILCLVLYTIIDSRTENMTDVIFGGVDGAYIKSDSVSFLDPASVNTPEPTADIWPQIDQDEFLDDWRYKLVNGDNLLSSAFEPEELTEIDGYRMSFDARAVGDLNDMIQALKDAGFNVVIGAAYRTYTYQNQLFNGKTTQIAMEMGISTDYNKPEYQLAVEEAKKITMFPGSSEHQLGLAVDIYDRHYQKLVYENMNHDFYDWLDEHCAEYGFIKRYPTRKVLLTGWDEPWHYRYVGKEAAQFIMENGICFEEFYAHYNPNYTL